MTAADAAASLEKIAWSLGAGALGWLAAIVQHKNQTADMRAEIRELQRRVNITLSLLGAIAEKSGVQPEYIASMLRIAAPPLED